MPKNKRFYEFKTKIWKISIKIKKEIADEEI
jgi:hypothetical protein